MDESEYTTIASRTCKGCIAEKDPELCNLLPPCFDGEKEIIFVKKVEKDSK